MKKILIRAIVLFLVFIFGMAGFACLMNSQNTENKTDLQTAVIPCMAMQIGDMEVNRMYGYAEEMQTDFMRDTLTPVGTDKTLAVSITPYGREIQSLVYEVRTSDGSKVIENNKIKNFEETADGRQTASFTLQKSILMNQEYSLMFTLNTEEGSWNYYTRIIQRAGLSTDKYIAFVDSFYTKTFQQDSRGDLSTYLESDSSASNNSFNDLNIHSSLDMITWGSLAPKISRPGIPSIKDINENTGSISLTYYITAEDENGGVERYQVDEFYRMRYDQTRVRLLDFQRSAKQVLTTEENIVSGGRLQLGVTQKDVQYLSDSDGNIIAFVQQGDLWSYNMETNKVTRIFSFRDEGSNDERNDNSQHDIDIIRVSKNGDVDFVLYGYMNRGDHEGNTGISVCHYSADQNVVEEKLFLTSQKSFEFLKQELQDFSYISKDGHFYLFLGDTLYQMNMEDKSYTAILKQVDQDCFQSSGNKRYVAWMEGMDQDNTSVIIYMDLEKGEQQKIEAESGTKIRLFGFINNDIVYGVAKDEDIKKDAEGATQFAMSEIRIQSKTGELKKTYHEEGYYTMDVQFQDNLLELIRAKKQGDTYELVSNGRILNNVRDKQDENFAVVSTTTVRQAGITGIQLSSDSSQEPLTMEAKLMENLKDNTLDMEIQEENTQEYYVYAWGKLLGTYENAALAVAAADENAGVVLNSTQQYIWERSNAKDTADIAVDDIPEAVKKAPLDAAKLNEDVKNTGTAVDLTGCTLEQILYEVGEQRPVITKGKDGKAMVIVGFDLYNTRLYDPATGETSYLGLQDSKKTFEENGNVFICYVEKAAE